MEYKGLLYEVEEHVATITLNRPEASNGFTEAFCYEILDALKKAAIDTDVYVVALRANGKVFSIGGDLADMKRLSDADDHAGLAIIADLVMEISTFIMKLHKPVALIANGAVAGAAFNIALACDFVFATPQTRFIQAFVNVGLIPDAGGLFLLSRAVGINRAMQLAMTGDGVSAEEGQEYGFVYKVLEEEKLERTVKKYLWRFANGPRLSYAAMKELLWKAQFKDFHEYAQLELKMQHKLGRTDDFKEGVRAYAERRRPKFEGK